MENQNKIKNGLDMIYLSGCVLNGKKTDLKRISEMDLAGLYKMCKFHSMTAVVCSALESSGIDPGNEWKEQKAKSVKKNMLLDAQRQDLFRFMDQKKIWHMPMKGIILKDLYPGLGLRQMSDNDILYDISFRNDVRQYFESHGFKTETFGKVKDDVYHKPPVYNFEMHVALFGEENNDIKNASVFIKYYENIKDRLIRDSKDDYLYHFSDEDFYIYFILHAYKHYDLAGTGVRSLMDEYLFVKSKEKFLNMEYIQSQMNYLGVADFENAFRTLSMKIFDDPECDLSETQTEMLDQFIGAGTYGTSNNYADKKFKKYAEKTGNTKKSSYLLKRLFPDIETYRLFYPFFYKHRVLLPACWVYRTTRGILDKKRRNKWKSELRSCVKKRS